MEYHLQKKKKKNHYVVHLKRIIVNQLCFNLKKKKARKHIADSDGQLKNRVFENEGIARDMSRNAIWNFRIQS